MRRPIIAGNWKLNTCSKSGPELVAALKAEVPAPSDKVEVVVCPPYPYLGLAVAEAAGSGVEVGGQNAWHETSGAFTGEVACEMLQDVGCKWVVLGHSERRQINGESDELINTKVRKALEVGLKVILCVGELLEDRESDRTEAVLETQMTGGLVDVSAEQMADVVIAYEPVWAIGTGRTPSLEQVGEVHDHIRSVLAGITENGEAVRILYGGSMNPGNARDILALANVNGGLVGGASLKIDDFCAIVRSCG